MPTLDLPLETEASQLKRMHHYLGNFIVSAEGGGLLEKITVSQGEGTSLLLPDCHLVAV